ncbi:hypothetical protein GJW-30_1_01048 [Variibacter gotjawalensis]|uniref:Protein ImuA n=1 Tax=Variibacter gotjawalensis TaxID=1333996 RepID=A0A0S3PRE9_9BRAD|nr:hypothetical protein [Variibacter gotjawalensis]NIK48828.1 protein ImuA [Variibacter gotjawalensis]RZS50688.1 protein ImuA [Variibacter gotjawalensis]BAT58522.1 hypothetical protein GJW-30_1_01048 [Variibacter gotjawalensis]
MTRDALAALRRTLATLQQGPPSAPALFSTGAATIDESLGGGLAHAGMHELYAREGFADAAAVAGFGLGLALRAADTRHIVWVRQTYVDTEAGWLYGSGLSAFGLDPARLVLVRARDPTAALRATAEAARCAALGAVIVELWGSPPVLDLKASRRLALALQQSGVTLLMMRLGAEPSPSAAMTRWSVSSRASAALEANAPGRPAFDIHLLRHRAGITGRWSLEWDRDDIAFADPAPLSRPLVSVPRGQPAAADADRPAERSADWRRAG